MRMKKDGSIRLSKKEPMMVRKRVWYKYKIPSMSNLHRRKINAIFLSPANSLEHEMAKCRECYMMLEKGEKFITEAATCSSPNRRVDIVNLDTGEEVEIETDPKRASRFDGMPNVRVVKLWEENNDSEKRADRKADKEEPEEEV